MIGLAYPAISPTVFSLGFFELRWYSLAYLVGIIVGWWLVSCRNKKYGLGYSRQNLEDAAFYITLGIILGGRLGYVFFYGDGQYWAQPWQIFAVWRGGMSFHGGIIGVIIAIALLARKLNSSFLKLTDLVSPVVPIGIFLGRIANFVNDELWGRVTDVAWAVRFPRGGYLPRHPSQIYEACLEGILLFVVLNLMWRNKYCRERVGLISGTFLLGYAACRALVEQFREPDAQIGFLFGHVTMGQCLSVPAIAVGVYLIWQALWRQKQA